LNLADTAGRKKVCVLRNVWFFELRSVVLAALFSLSFQAVVFSQTVNQNDGASPIRVMVDPEFGKTGSVNLRVSLPSTTVAFERDCARAFEASPKTAIDKQQWLKNCESWVAKLPTSIITVSEIVETAEIWCAKSARFEDQPSDTHKTRNPSFVAKCTRERTASMSRLGGVKPKDIEPNDDILSSKTDDDRTRLCDFRLSIGRVNTQENMNLCKRAVEKQKQPVRTGVFPDVPVRIKD
jgi:hypothetical protein